MMVEAGRFCVNLRPKASSPKASSAKASSAEGHLSWNVDYFCACRITVSFALLVF